MAWTPLFLTLLTHYTGAWILGLRMWPQEDAGLCPSPGAQTVLLEPRLTIPASFFPSFQGPGHGLD